MEDTTPLLNHSSGDHICVYRRRWYILAVYGILSFTQAAVWNTWGPLSTTCEEAFGWHVSTIAWMSNWGPIAYITTGFFFFWLLQAKGLRPAVLVSAFLLAVGTVLRVITSDPEVATLLIHVGQFLCGLSGPIAFACPPTISALWFPPHERVTATSIGSSAGLFGIAISFIIGPAVVGSYVEVVNESDVLRDQLNQVTSVKGLSLRVHQERMGIMQFMYYECIWSIVTFLLILCYFPSMPPHPPSASAIVERESYWSGLWSLRHKSYFLVMAFIYGISTGVLNGWYTVLNVNLSNLNISESQAGWIGFYSTLSSCICALVVGRFADTFVRRMKQLILVIFVLAAVCFLVFALMLAQVLDYSEVTLYFTLIVGCSLLNAAVPLMCELSCELAYPTSEGAANGFLTYLNSVAVMLFLVVFSFPDVGTVWINWALIGAIIICIPLIALLKGRFNRLEIDEELQRALYLTKTHAA
ncbi:solute carrier family 49 member 4 homolog [Physella acuta]|uniref:solute carrier family 49 member 4 homolog n=1 Tax=Physella acuta TaxID=109671 RepID=UPI0027DB4346|nr:solute carrier family 49 member 4 homolog [Physella acuta]